MELNFFRQIFRFLARFMLLFYYLSSKENLNSLSG